MKMLLILIASAGENRLGWGLCCLCELRELCEHNKHKPWICQEVAVNFSNFVKSEQIKELNLVFYDNYIRLCNSVNKTPSAAAIEMGISKTSVNRWKNGSYPTDATMQRIANYFDVSIEALANGEFKENTAQADGVATDYFEQKEKPTPEDGSERNYGDSVLMDAFKRADESTQEAILLLLKLK